MKEWKMIHHANDNQKNSGMVILISDKIDKSKQSLSYIRVYNG